MMRSVVVSMCDSYSGAFCIRALGVMDSRSDNVQDRILFHQYGTRGRATHADIAPYLPFA
jgi:hypothetical protein